MRTFCTQISIIGSGNWAASISTIVCQNAARHYLFKEEVNQWVFEEIIDGRKLSHLINSTHENPKYLPGIVLPSNLRAVADLMESVNDTDLLIFVMPHQFLPNILSQIEGKVKPTAKAISLIKGFMVENGRPLLFTEMITRKLGIECCILSGANVANSVARGEFCETTLGYVSQQSAELWISVFDFPSFKVNALPDVCGVELCGAVKNVIALASGFCDGLALASNTKAALIRLGVEEMKLFSNLFFDGILEDTFNDSAGYADTITTCFGGRNARCAAEFVKRRPSNSPSDPEVDEALWIKIEKELLHGQKLQGTLTTKEVYQTIEHHKMFDHFPLFTTTHHVAFRGLPANRIVEIFMMEDHRPIKTAAECHPCLITNTLRQLRHNLVKITTKSGGPTKAQVSRL